MPRTPVIGLVGDSNFVLGASELESALEHTGVVTFAAVSGAYATSPFWPSSIAAVHADRYVVDLGVNDTSSPGTPTTQGYAGYAQKIDGIMHMLGAGGARPVWWTNLPCALEPPSRRTGCATVNGALAAAASRWPNLHVVDWAKVADGHPAYMDSGALGGVHYTVAGYTAYAATVARYVR